MYIRSVGTIILAMCSDSNELWLHFSHDVGQLPEAMTDVDYSVALQPGVVLFHSLSKLSSSVHPVYGVIVFCYI